LLLRSPLFDDELVGREAANGLQSSPEFEGAVEVGEMATELIMVVAIEALHGGVFDPWIKSEGAVHPFDLTIGP
jgi:hypothetical protein